MTSATTVEEIAVRRKIGRLDSNRRAIRLWLGVVLLTLFCLVLVGGATRLTDSGLSITEWKPIHGVIPPRDVLLRFIADHPEQASKREIAKAFGLKGEARVELKALLKSFEEDGFLEKRRKSLVRPGALPQTA